MDTSIVIPVHNSMRTLRWLLPEIMSYLSAFGKQEIEIILVDLGSTDGTTLVKFPGSVRVIEAKRNWLDTGVKEAQGNNIIIYQIGAKPCTAALVRYLLFFHDYVKIGSVWGFLGDRKEDVLKSRRIKDIKWRGKLILSPIDTIG